MLVAQLHATAPQLLLLLLLRSSEDQKLAPQCISLKDELDIRMLCFLGYLVIKVVIKLVVILVVKFGSTSLRHCNKQRMARMWGQA